MHETQDRLPAVKLLVVIVNYRVAHLTIDCLRSVAEEVHRVDGTQVAVCENGTGDDSAEKIQKAIDADGWRDWCKLTTLKTNLGFTGGNSAVLRPALQSADPPRYFLLLNADTVIKPNAFIRGESGRFRHSFRDRNGAPPRLCLPNYLAPTERVRRANGADQHRPCRQCSAWRERSGGLGRRSGVLQSSR